ncbi:MAG: hypothetical protein ACRDD1_03120 [Planctomycetia bacterium]
MHTMYRRCAAGFLIVSAMTAGVGCQTYQAGQVLPSGRHLRDDVDYFPKGPQFPLANELNAMQQAEAERAEAVRTAP